MGFYVERGGSGNGSAGSDLVPTAWGSKPAGYPNTASVGRNPSPITLASNEMADEAPDVSQTELNIAKRQFTSPKAKAVLSEVSIPKKSGYYVERVGSKPEQQAPDQSSFMDGALGTLAKGTSRVIQAAGRGAAPYAAGAAAGAAMGAPFGGVGAIPGAIAGAGAVGAVDLGVSLYNPIAKATGLPQAKTASEYVNKLLDKLGVVQPETTGERIIQGGVSGAASALSGAGAFQQLAKATSGVPSAVLSQLGKGPVSQAIAGGTSGLAGQTAHESDAGPLAETLWTLGGAMAPGMIAGTLSPNKIMRGGTTTAEAEQRIASAKLAGVTPDATYAAPSAISRALRQGLSGTEELRKHSENVVNQIQTEAERIANNIGPIKNTDAVGKSIEKSLGGDGFLKRAGAVESSLWDKWWGMAQGPMPLNNTLAYLGEKMKNIPGAETISDQLLKDKDLSRVLSVIKGDMPSATSTTTPVMGAPEWAAPTQTTVTPAKTTVPYEAVKELKTLIGEKLDPTNLSPDVNRKALKGLYASLSKDIGEYATQLGPDAEKAFNRANKFTIGKHDRIDTFLQSVQGKTPSQVWRYATAPEAVSDGGHQFLAVNRSLTPAERETFHATFVNRMGINKTTGSFDPKQFADKYSTLPYYVRSALMPQQQRAAMDRLTTVIKDMDRVGAFGNSNSPGYVGAYMVMGALLHAHPGALLTLAFASNKSEKIAKMLTNPTIISHISGVNKVPAEVAAKSLNALSQIIKSRNDSQDSQ